MTAAEFTTWKAYDAIEGIPWPWLETGTIVANAVNLWSRRHTFSPWDFMPCQKPPAPKQTPAQRRRAWEITVAIVNARLAAKE